MGPVIRRLALCLAAAVAAVPLAAAGDFGAFRVISATGPVRVVDGDTLVMRVARLELDGMTIEGLIRQAAAAEKWEAVDRLQSLRDSLGGSERIRLHGIDAPERAQDCERRGGDRYRCGERSTERLQSLLGINPLVGVPGPNAPAVVCEGTETDRHGRLIAKCWAGETGINRYMVVEGWAVADRRKSMDYAADEDAAKAAKRGIWASRFVIPWDWRKGERLPAE